MPLHDTIVAISTPPGRGGLGVVRLSGPRARAIAEGMVRIPGDSAWHAWRANMGELLDRGGHVVDQVVATFFEKPRSYTAEDVVEISCHGSPVVLRHAVERAVEAGARIAEPGEFTLRAFLNGRLDLPRAEAGIDFAEDDVSVAPSPEILRRIDPILEGVLRLADSFQYGALVRSGLSLAIVGRPNVGKSSLFNALLEQDRALVTDVPGTTRDLISETASIGGIPVKLYDTAGIREDAELVESLGIERSFQAMADADLTLVVMDLSEPPGEPDRALAARVQAQGRFLLVGNKSDLGSAGLQAFPAAAPVSALTGEGIPELRSAILEAVAPRGAFEWETRFISSPRRQRLLRESAAALEQARAATEAGIPHEMLLLDLYSALRPIDAITGATTADDILNRIFSTFCIGK